MKESQIIVRHKDGSFNELVFQSTSLIQLNTVKIALNALYKNTSSIVEISEAKPALSEISQLFEIREYTNALRDDFIERQKLELIIYPCIFNDLFKSVYFLYFRFNESVNNFSAFDENGCSFNLGRFPNRKQVINAIELGFLNLENKFKKVKENLIKEFYIESE